MNLDKLLIVAAFVCFAVAFICATGTNLILGLGSIGWIAGGFGLATLAMLLGGVRLRR
jgi:hypothetical protein